MRRVTFQSVYEGVLRRMGHDPVGDTVTQDIQRNVARKITRRAKTGVEMWDFAEWTTTEERAFRSVWNNTRQFLKAGEDGLPDEFYYLVTPGYYRVKSTAPSDPPIGTLPTNTTYFESFDPSKFIARDQTCRRSLGNVLGIYPSDPSLNGNSGYGLRFRPSARGVQVQSDAGNTVFVFYTLPPPRFTMVPYINGKAYVRGDIVFYFVTGDCYRATADSTSHLPIDTNYWALEPMPEILASYTEAGAYADILRDGARNGAPQSNATTIAMAEAEAQGYIQHEIDLLLAQGQKHYYLQPYFPTWLGGWRNSEPWFGDRVFTLTDVCEQDWIFVPTPSQPQAGLYYFPNVNSLKTTTPTLISQPSLSFAVGAMAVISTGQHFRLDSGVGNLADPGQGQPSDYNLATHNVHWTEVL